MTGKEFYYVQSGEIFKLIVTFIRNVRNKYSFPAIHKLDVYIDFLSKENITPLDLCLLDFCDIISKKSIGNCTVSYELTDLFAGKTHFEHSNIEGFDIYISVPSFDLEAGISVRKKEINRLLDNLKVCNDKMSNDNFKSKASESTIAIESKKILDLRSKIYSLTLLSLLSTHGAEYYFLIIYFGDKKRLFDNIIYMREFPLPVLIETYSSEWFDFIYAEDIKSEELMFLYKYIHDELVFNTPVI